MSVHHLRYTDTADAVNQLLSIAQMTTLTQALFSAAIAYDESAVYFAGVYAFADRQPGHYSLAQRFQRQAVDARALLEKIEG